MFSEEEVIRRCDERDFETILSIVNDSAEAYRGVIPADRFGDSYMPREELADEMAAGVEFWALEEDGAPAGVMGVQSVADVALIRHAYVRTAKQRRGIGGRLLRHIRSITDRPLLVGTWAAADWAIRFYRRHGFALVPAPDTADVLRRYWDIPARQIETSVVLAEREWLKRQDPAPGVR